MHFIQLVYAEVVHLFFCTFLKIIKACPLNYGYGPYPSWVGEKQNHIATENNKINPYINIGNIITSFILP